MAGTTRLWLSDCPQRKGRFRMCAEIGTTAVGGDVGLLRRIWHCESLPAPNPSVVRDGLVQPAILGSRLIGNRRTKRRSQCVVFVFLAR
jgi:hypothetical protein